MKFFGAFFIGTLIIWALFGTLNARRYHTQPAVQNIATSSDQTTAVFNEAAADGLDLQAVTELVKKASSGEELEKQLNRPEGINNLDLDADGKVDFIKVTEYGNKEAYGFSLTAEPESGEEQELATIEITREEEQAQIQVVGNHGVYGHDHAYRSSVGIGTLLLWSYLLSPHPFYVSPWRYGYYPSYYSPYHSVGRNVYTTRTRTITQNTTINKLSSSQIKNTGLQSPNKGKVASKGIKKSLANPTQTQKQFRARTTTKTVKSGGFGSKTGSSSKSSSVRGSSSSRGFGGSGK